MPWTDYAKEPDDAVHDWLRSTYTAYRNALSDPTVLPEEAQVMWDTPWAGQTPLSFMVAEDQTDHNNRGMGVHNIDFYGHYYVKVTTRWIREGKPVYISAMRDFIVKTLHVASLPTNFPAILNTEAGIYEMWPTNSRTYQPPPESAQADFWICEVRFNTRVQNSII